MAERSRKAQPGSEREFRERVMKLAKEHGWLRMHPLRSQLPAERGGGWSTNMSGEKGYPDLTFVHPVWGRVVILELKGQRGRLDPLQERWIKAWQRAMRRAPKVVACYVVKPEDWDEVQHLLTRP
jgi:hypothetical protein